MNTNARPRPHPPALSPGALLCVCALLAAAISGCERVPEPAPQPHHRADAAADNAAARAAAARARALLEGHGGPTGAPAAAPPDGLLHDPGSLGLLDPEPPALEGDDPLTADDPPSPGHDHDHHDDAGDGALPPGLEPLSTDALLARVEARGAPPLLIHLWATWCEPCREEWPELRAFAARHPPGALTLLALSVDPPETRAAIAPFLEGLPEAMRVRWWTDRDQTRLFEALGGGFDGALPATFLFIEGERTRVIEGPASAETLAELDALLRVAP